MSIESIKARLNDVMQHYDGDFDVVPGTPRVTWTDQKILEILDLLLDEVERHSNQAFVHQGNQEIQPQFLVENRAPGENSKEFTDKGASIYEWACVELQGIQLTENTWQQAQESRRELELLLAQVIVKMEEE